VVEAYRVTVLGYLKCVCKFTKYFVQMNVKALDYSCQRKVPEAEEGILILTSSHKPPLVDNRCELELDYLEQHRVSPGERSTPQRQSELQLVSVQ
jgi:hypothetical protein